MTIRLGFKPVTLSVVLTAGGDFVSSLVADTAWPAGTAIALSFGDTTWPATIAGTSAGWDIPAAQVDALLATGPREVQLLYTSAGVTLVWGKGTVTEP